MKIKIERIEENFARVLEHSSLENGIQRFSYSVEDLAVRAILLEQLEELGLEIRLDGVGNLFASYNPLESNKRPILIGSHIDTVPDGGKFDGLTGVLCSLEVIQTMIDEQIQPQIPIVFVVFAEEEGSNFGTTMLGSKYWKGQLNEEDLNVLKNKDGRTALSVIQEAGFDPSNRECSFTSMNPAAMIELHVEQGGILEEKNLDIGVVTKIIGMNSYEITIHGTSNHAGSTPMHLRKDPLLPAAELILYVESLPNTYGSDLAVATVGKILAKPNGSNVISSEVSFTVDIRDTSKLGIESMSLALQRKVGELCKPKAFDYQIELVGKSDPVALSSSIIQVMESRLKLENIPYHKMPSGAVHDCAILADAIDVGMIFLPSKGGISHSPDEYTSMEAIEQGAQLLFDCVKELAG